MARCLWTLLAGAPDRLARVFLASFPAGAWQANCYLAATGPGRECVVVDPEWTRSRGFGHWSPNTD